VKHPFSLEKFFLFLSSQSINISDKQKDQFAKFYQLIKTRAKTQNLISKNDVWHLVERHFLTSALLVACLPDKIKGKMIDVGTGAGFPGIILKIIKPEISLSLLDSSRKKVLFLEEACEQLGLNCPIINQRCEEYFPPTSERYAIVISRAVARLNMLWEWCEHLMAAHGNLYAFKGGEVKKELGELDPYNLKSEIIVPDKNWTEASEYLKQKFIIKLEK
jgi:16S rRNA (guanine527-N7)-methyltransferase